MTRELNNTLEPIQERDSQFEANLQPRVQQMPRQFQSTQDGQSILQRDMESMTSTDNDQSDPIQNSQSSPQGDMDSMENTGNEQFHVSQDGQLSPRSNFDNTASTDNKNSYRETVRIIFDSDHGMQSQDPDNNSERQPYVIQGPLSPTASRSAAEEQKVQYNNEVRAVTPQQPHQVDSSEYDPDWIIQEPRDITDSDYYDPDADHGHYTHGSDQGDAAGLSELTENTEFERPREVPSVQRHTMLVVKEDTDCFMTIVGGAVPMPGITETQPVVPGQQGLGRQSFGMKSQEDALRRQQDSDAAQDDVNFWMSLMQKEE